MGIRRRLLGAVDRAIVASTEMAKALIREVVLLIARLTDSTSAAILTIVSHKAYYAARRSRIHTGPEVPPDESGASDRPSGFARMFQMSQNGSGSSLSVEELEDDRLRRRSMPRSGSGNSISRMVRNRSDTSLASLCSAHSDSARTEATTMTWFERPLKDRVTGVVRTTSNFAVNACLWSTRLLIMWIPGMGARAERMYRSKRSDGDVRSLGALPNPGHTAMQLESDRLGLLGDTQMRLMIGLEWIGLRARLFAAFVVGRSNEEADDDDVVPQHTSLKDFRTQNVRRKGNFSDLVRRAGYPFTQIQVQTEDGYILELHRLPRPESDKVMFLQHGVMDSSYSFIANGASDGLAFRAFDKGYDVFMGNFRGTSSLKHVQPDISAKDYWDYTLDDHGNYDIRAFIAEIRRTKQKELGHQGHVDITAVAHSMGAAATMIYLVNMLRGRKQHHLSRIVLMSPAGYHRRIPRLCKITGPIINRTLSNWTYTLSIPSQGARTAASRLMMDTVSLPAVRDVLYSFGETFLGGDFKETLHSHINTVTDNMIAGTSSQVFKQFWNCYNKGKFLSYDYGLVGNRRAYGTDHPVEYFEHYGLIDVPCHFIAGLNDNLIPAKDALKHYKVLHRCHPTLATCMPFAGKGHIDFTYGLDREIAHQIFTHAGPPGSRLVSPGMPSKPSMWEKGLLSPFSVTSTVDTPPSSSGPSSLDDKHAIDVYIGDADKQSLRGTRPLYADDEHGTCGQVSEAGELDAVQDEDDDDDDDGVSNGSVEGVADGDFGDDDDEE